MNGEEVKREVFQKDSSTSDVFPSFHYEKFHLLVFSDKRETCIFFFDCDFLHWNKFLREDHFFVVCFADFTCLATEERLWWEAMLHVFQKLFVLVFIFEVLWRLTIKSLPIHHDDLPWRQWRNVVAYKRRATLQPFVSPRRDPLNASGRESWCRSFPGHEESTCRPPITGSCLYVLTEGLVDLSRISNTSVLQWNHATWMRLFSSENLSDDEQLGGSPPSRSSESAPVYKSGTAASVREAFSSFEMRRKGRDNLFQAACSSSTSHGVSFRL